VSRDVVALVSTAPDAPALLSGMAAAGEDLLVVPAAGGAVVQLCDAPDGAGPRALLTIEEPLLVSVPGEVARLLGAETAARVSGPVWWVEIRAAAVPEHAAELAYRFAGALVERLGGVIWPPGDGTLPERASGTPPTG
jgi:hypothetical protein